MPAMTLGNMKMEGKIFHISMTATLIFKGRQITYDDLDLIGVTVSDDTRSIIAAPNKAPDDDRIFGAIKGEPQMGISVRILND
jgi:hypothetical protein